MTANSDFNEMSKSLLCKIMKLSKTAENLPLSESHFALHGENEHFKLANSRSSNYITKLIEKSVNLTEECNFKNILQDKSEAESFAQVLHDLNKDIHEKIEDKYSMKKIRSQNSLKNNDSNANEKKEISLESKIRKIKNSFQSPTTIDPTQLPKKPPNLSKPLKNIFKAFPKGKLVQFGVEYIDCEGEKWDKLIETLKNEECLTIGLFEDQIHSYSGIVTQITLATYNTLYILNAFTLHNQILQLKDVLSNPSILKISLVPPKNLLSAFLRDFGILISPCIEICRLLSTKNSDASKVVSTRELLDAIDFEGGYDLKKCLEVYNSNDPKSPLLNEINTELSKIVLFLNDLFSQQKIIKDLASAPAKLKKHMFDSFAFYRQFCSEMSTSQVDKSIQMLKSQSLASYGIKHIALIELLVGLCHFRDAEAKRLDVSPKFLLPDHMILKIICVLPTEYSKLVACCFPTPKIVHEKHSQIIDLCSKAKANKLSNPDLSDASKKNTSNYVEDMELDLPESQNQKNKNSDDNDLSFENAIAAKYVFISKKSSNIFSEEERKMHHVDNCKQASILLTNAIPDIRYFAPEDSLIYQYVQSHKKTDLPKLNVISNSKQEPTTQQTNEKNPPKKPKIQIPGNDGQTLVEKSPVGDAKPQFEAQYVPAFDYKAKLEADAQNNQKSDANSTKNAAQTKKVSKIKNQIKEYKDSIKNMFK